MIEFYYSWDIPKNFTGVCKLVFDNSIRYFKDGLYHKEDGAAIIFEDGKKEWYYKNICCGSERYQNFYLNEDNIPFTNEAWVEVVRELKRRDELKIFI